MPPRRSNRFELGLSGQQLVVVEDRLIAGRHLSQQFLSMCKELKRSVQCPVCLFEPCHECLDRVMVVRLCGHLQCAVCVLAQQNEGDGDTKCPVCRA